MNDWMVPAFAMLAAVALLILVLHGVLNELSAARAEAAQAKRELDAADRALKEANRKLDAMAARLEAYRR